VQTVNSHWGLAAIRARRVAREMIGRVKTLRHAGAAAPHAGEAREAGAALTPAMQAASDTGGAHPD
jgi:hypothetical protein